MSIHPIVRQIIDRDCHVSMTASEVVRHVILQLREGYKTFRALPGRDRRRFIEDCIQRHGENFRLYADVMNGGRWQHRRGPADSAVLPPERLSGKELCRMMGRHRVTIAELAQRTGISQNRIRRVREQGISDPLVVRDWIQAITGNDPGPVPEQLCIGNRMKDAECGFCGCPLLVGDRAYSYLSEIFCGHFCCRLSRGWK